MTERNDVVSHSIQPSSENRLAARERPTGSALMYQSWIDLLFLHWKMDAALIQPCLPKGLYVDTFDGHAWVGLVPFFMKNIRFRGTPAVPWVSHFLELNLRTYVFDEKCRPGVWFFSLDCNQPLAVWTARTLFHLPYQHASMQAQKGNSTIDYRSQRKTQLNAKRSSRFDYTYKESTELAQPGSLEFFLAERYLLFSQSGKGQLLVGQVHHKPYPLVQVDVPVFETDLFELNGLPSPPRPFDHAIGSRGVHVEVFPLKRA